MLHISKLNIWLWLLHGAAAGGAVAAALGTGATLPACV
jgi:hypothetical protein